MNFIASAIVNEYHLQFLLTRIDTWCHALSHELSTSVYTFLPHVYIYHTHFPILSAMTICRRLHLSHRLATALRYKFHKHSYENNMAEPPSYAALFESNDPPSTAAVTGEDAEPPLDPPMTSATMDRLPRIPRCGCPITERKDPRGRRYRNCRWSELQCPWVHHALWRKDEGRAVLMLTPCPLHPECLLALCRKPHPDNEE